MPLTGHNYMLVLVCRDNVSKLTLVMSLQSLGRAYWPFFTTALFAVHPNKIWINKPCWIVPPNYQLLHSTVNGGVTVGTCKAWMQNLFPPGPTKLQQPLSNTTAQVLNQKHTSLVGWTQYCRHWNTKISPVWLCNTTRWAPINLGSQCSAPCSHEVH